MTTPSDTAHPEGELHPVTAAMIDSFALALKGKLRAAEIKYGHGDSWLADDWADKCRADLLAHVHKGDPRDVAAYAAFCWAHGWSTTPDTPPSRPQGEEGLSPLDAERLDAILTEAAREPSFSHWEGMAETLAAIKRAALSNQGKPSS